MAVIPKEQYTGKIVETLPVNFTISNISHFGKIEKEKDVQKIIWDVNWNAQSINVIEYTIAFPSESPQFYLLGPLELRASPSAGSGQSVFSEARSWQVAADTSGDIAHDTTVTGNNGAGATTVASSAITTGGTNRLLIATVVTDSSTRTVSSISGASLTWEKITSQTSSTTINTESWRAFASSVLSSQTVTATISSSGKAAIVVSAYSGTNITGSNGNNAVGVYATGSGSTANGSVSLTTSGTNSLVVSSLGVANNPATTAGSSQTINGQSNATTTPLAAQERQDSLTANRGTSVTSSYTFSANVWAIVAVEILGQGPTVVQHETTATGTATSGTTVATSSGITTSGPNRLLIATVSVDGNASNDVTSISGGSLTWVEISARAVTTTGERIEMWRAFASSALSSQTITATHNTSLAAAIVVSAYFGTNTSGSNGSGAIGNTLDVNGSSTSPSLSLTTKGRNSLVISGLTANSNPTITAGTNQTINGQAAASTNISSAQERQNYLTTAAGTSVTSSYTLGTGNIWAIAIVEILGDDPGIILDTSTTAFYTSGANLTFSHTVESNHANRLLVVVITRRSGADCEVPNRLSHDIDYAGTNMSQAVWQDSAGGTTFIYYLANPATGANNVVVTPCAEGPDFRAAAVSFYNVDQASPLDSAAGTGGGTGTAGNVSHSVTTAFDKELVINGIAHESSSAPTLPSGNGQTSIHLTDEGQWDTGASWKIANGAGSVSMGFDNGSSATYAHAISSFKQLLVYNQTAYRWFDNDNAVTVTTAKAANNTTATAPAAGTVFRLRMLIHVSGQQLAISGKNFKLQFAAVGTDSVCDVNFDGETYADVSTTGNIKYDTGNTPADGDNLTANGSLDPTHGSDTKVSQDYEEANNFTNSVAAIPQNQDGLWDFALTVDSGAPADTKYCFRVYNVSDSNILDTYTVIPEITTVPENWWVLLGVLPLMLVFIKWRRKRME